MIVDGLGSSETGGQLAHVSAGGRRPPPARSRSAPAPRRRQRGPRPRARAGRRRSSAGWPRAAGCRSATWATRPRPRAPSRRSTACATRCPATGPGSPPTASSSCTAATRSRSTPAARRSSPRRSSGARRTTPRCTTSSWSAGRASAGARRSWPSCGSATARRRPTADAARAEGDAAHRPLQAPEGDRLRRRGRAHPRRQGRLPLGQGGRRRERRLTRPATPASGYPMPGTGTPTRAANAPRSAGSSNHTSTQARSAPERWSAS